MTSTNGSEILNVVVPLFYYFNYYKTPVKTHVLSFMLYSDMFRLMSHQQAIFKPYLLRLCIGRTAHSWSRGIALLIYDHGTRRG